LAAQAQAGADVIDQVFVHETKGIVGVQSADLFRRHTRRPLRFDAIRKLLVGDFWWSVIRHVAFLFLEIAYPMA
jgi:hypothetical protein